MTIVYYNLINICLSLLGSSVQKYDCVCCEAARSDFRGHLKLRAVFSDVPWRSPSTDREDRASDYDSAVCHGQRPVHSLSPNTRLQQTPKRPSVHQAILLIENLFKYKSRSNPNFLSDLFPLNLNAVNSLVKPRNTIAKSIKSPCRFSRSASFNWIPRSQLPGTRPAIGALAGRVLHVPPPNVRSS